MTGSCLWRNQLRSSDGTDLVSTLFSCVSLLLFVALLSYLVITFLTTHSVSTNIHNMKSVVKYFLLPNKSRIWIWQWINLWNLTMITRTIFISLFLFLVIVKRQYCHQDSESNQNDIQNISRSDKRVGRFLNLFSVIRFSNVPCTTQIGINGTCYTEKQCKEKSGNYFWWVNTQSLIGW